MFAHGWRRSRREMLEWAKLCKLCRGYIGNWVRMVGRKGGERFNETEANQWEGLSRTHVSKSGCHSTETCVGARVLMSLSGVRRCAPEMWGLSKVHTIAAKWCVQACAVFGYAFADAVRWVENVGSRPIFQVYILMIFLTLRLVLSCHQMGARLWKVTCIFTV